MQKKMYCKSLVIGIIVLFIGAGVYPSSGIILEEKPIMPTINGNTLYVGGDGPGNYSSIQDAIDDAVDGDTVYVYDDSSPYYENVIVNKSINLIGEDRDTTVIDGSGNGDVVNISADEVVISDFTIQNSGSNGFDSGINIYYRDNDNISIINNNIFYNDLGIFIDWSWDDLVEGNNISFNRYGVWIRHSLVTISDNTISNNLWRGIMLWGDENVITNNIISGNLSDTYVDEGIEMEGTNNIISGNTITESDEAISMHIANNNQIIGNNICSNPGFLWLDRSNRNLISQNNFINNEGIPLTFFNSFFNKWESNYWNKTRIFPYFIFGVIGIGFISIPWFNIDWSPAREPYDI